MEENNMIFRNHPIVIFRQPFLVLNALVIFILKDVFNLIIDKNELGLESIREYFDTFLILDSKQIIVYVCILIFGVLLLIYGYFRWKNSTIELEQDKIIFHKQGSFSKRTKSVAYKNITNVTVKSTLFSKLVGYKKVSCDINSTKTADEDDYVIYLKNALVDAFKGEIARHQNMSRANVDAANAAMVNDVPMNSVAVNDVPSNVAALNDVSTLDGEINGVGSDSAFDQIHRSKIRDDISFDRQFTNLEVLRHIFFESGIQILLSIASITFVAIKIKGYVMILLVLVILWQALKSIWKSMNAFFGYHVMRQGSDIHVQFGLLSTNEYSIECRRITAIKTNQSMLARLFGYSKLSFEVIGIGNKSEENKELCLYLRDVSIQVMAGLLIPEFSIPKVTFAYPVKRYGLIVMGYDAIFVAILMYAAYFSGLIRWLEIKSAVLPTVAWIVVGVIYFYLILRYLFYTSLKLNESAILIRDGMFAKEITTIAYDRIDKAEVSASFPAKLFKLERIAIYFKDSGGKSMKNTGYFPKGYFQEVVDVVSEIRKIEDGN